MRNKCLKLTSAILVMALSSQAKAQVVIDPDAALDRAEARADQSADRVSFDLADAALNLLTFKLGEVATNQQPKKDLVWTLASDIGVTYSDNVNSGETLKLDSAHFTANARLSRRVKISEAVSLSLTARSNFDVVTDYSELRISNWLVDGKLTIGDSSKKLMPYIQVTSLALYEGQYENHIVTTHMYGIGAERKLALADKGVLTLDANLMRREATLQSSELNRAQLSAGYKGPAGTDLTWSITGQLRYSDFTGGTAANREDIQARISLGLAWKISESFSLTGTAFAVRNWSNTVGKSYSNLDIGPSMGFIAKF